MRISKVLIYLTRIVSFSLFLLILFHPTHNIYEHISSVPTIAVFVDNSLSMSIGTRYIRAINKLKELNYLWKSYKLEFFNFSDKLYPYAENMSSPLSKVTDFTQIFDFLEKRKSYNLGIIFSDGKHTSTNNPYFLIEKCPIPIHTVLVSEGAQQYKDVGIVSVSAPEQVFKNLPFNIDIKIKSTGFENKIIPVMVKENDTVITTKDVRLEKNDTDVQISYIPKTLGEKILTVSVPIYEGEVSKDNNTKKIRIFVKPGKIRVMYICGQPGYEYAFIRNVLKSDPNIELVSFVILRNPENIAFVPDEQLSLIPFPVHEIFQSELNNFDLLIFENFTYRRFGIGMNYLENIYNFVNERGNGFIMIGGENSFTAGGYKGTPIEELLPVELYPQQMFEESNKESYIVEPFKLEILDYEHPIMKLDENVESNKKLWDTMPQLASYNIVGNAKQGAKVLAVHPKYMLKGNTKMPIIAIWEKGKGRAGIIATNTTWRWSMLLAAEEKDYWVFQRFWKQFILWAAGCKKSSQEMVNIYLEKESYAINEEIKVRVFLYDEYLSPLDNSRVEAYLLLPDGKLEDLKSNTYLVSPGEYNIDITFSNAYPLGTYKIIVRGYKDKKYIGEAQKTFRLHQIDELATPTSDPSFLSYISMRTGGMYFDSIDSFDPQKINISKIHTKRIKRKIIFIDSPILYISLVLLLLIEWYLRRRTGKM